MGRNQRWGCWRVNLIVEDPEPLATAPAARGRLHAVSEQTALLALASIRGVGYWTLAHMAKAGVGFAAFLATNDTEEASAVLRTHGARLEHKTTGDWSTVRERALQRASLIQEELDTAGTRLIMAGDADFPSALNDLADAPASLFVGGNVSVLQEPSIAAVGTREPSEDGVWLCRFVGHCLRDWCAPTVSGLAAGVDQIVHEMSLRARVPTIAVLGTGICSEYPKGSADLRQRILDCGGAVVTEYLPNEKYSAENFVRRNRLQAALGRVLIPIEWAAKGGTAHTVRFAGSLGRPIAGLRLSDWPEGRVIFSNGAARNATTFTVPGQEVEFRGFVAKSLNGGPQPAQLSLI